MAARDVIVVGAGIFGATAALELRRRGASVTLLDPGPIPHPLAASTDISKVIRMEYGPDEDYMALAEQAREKWLEWNARWEEEGQDPLYHETGVLMVCQDRMQPGGFEFESFQRLESRGHRPERMDEHTLSQRFPAWAGRHYVDGFFHALGGWAESGRVVQQVVEWCRVGGVDVQGGERVRRLLERGDRVVGVETERGTARYADEIVVAVGAWASKLVPDLAPSIHASGHPVFHLRPADPAPFRAESFPVFTADIARTGFYGFPVNRDGLVKVALHRTGTPVDPDGERAVATADHDRLRTFLAETFPSLATEPVVSTRLCLYADTQDGDFWIARDPGREGLTVAGGGSGHGFKFAPVLGGLVADVIHGHVSPLHERFRWRSDLRLDRPREAARCHDAPH